MKHYPRNPRDKTPNRTSATAKIDPLTKGVITPINNKPARTKQTHRKRNPAV